MLKNCITLVPFEKVTVWCDGRDFPDDHLKESSDKNSLSHPKIYLNLGTKLEISCPYCNHLFKKDCNKG